MMNQAVETSAASPDASSREVEVRMAEDIAFGRLWQLPISAFCLAIPVLAIQLGCHERQSSALFPLTVYCLYIACSSVLITAMVVRLCALHDLRRFAFDIAFWFIATTLIAVPLGAALAFTSWIASIEMRLDARALSILRVSLAACLYLELVPVFFVTENTMAAAAYILRLLRRWRTSSRRRAA